MSTPLISGYLTAYCAVSSSFLTSAFLSPSLRHWNAFVISYQGIRSNELIFLHESMVDGYQSVCQDVMPWLPSSISWPGFALLSLLLALLLFSVPASCIIHVKFHLHGNTSYLPCFLLLSVRESVIFCLLLKIINHLAFNSLYVITTRFTRFN